MVHALEEGSDQSQFDGNGERSTHYPERGTDASTSQGDLRGTSSVTTSSELQERSSGLGNGEQRAPAMRKPNGNDLGKERPSKATKKGEQTQSFRSKVSFCSSVFWWYVSQSQRWQGFWLCWKHLDLEMTAKKLSLEERVMFASSFLYGKSEKQN